MADSVSQWLNVTGFGFGQPVLEKDAARAVEGIPGYSSGQPA